MLSVAGLAVGLAWIALVLPLLAISPGPVPGKELVAYAAAVGTPVAASTMLIVGGVRGFRQARRSDGVFHSLRSFAFLLAAIVGLLGAAYSVLIFFEVLGISPL